MSARILARMSVSVSASWNSSLTTAPADPATHGAREDGALVPTPKIMNYRCTISITNKPYAHV